MKEIPVQNHPNCFQVDDEDFHRINQFKWCVRGTAKNVIYRQKRIFNKNYTYPLANEILDEWNGLYDHKDRNSFNNQKDNLRATTVSLNAANKKKSENCSCDYKGVNFYPEKKHKNKYKVSIRKDGKLYHLGYFDNANDAARAYNNKATEFFGEFANLNIIPNENPITTV